MENGGTVGLGDAMILSQGANGGWVLIWALVDVFYVKHAAYEYNKKQLLNVLNN